jgi:hypothetical protein
MTGAMFHLSSWTAGVLGLCVDNSSGLQILLFWEEQSSFTTSSDEVVLGRDLLQQRHNKPFQSSSSQHVEEHAPEAAGGSGGTYECDECQVRTSFRQNLKTKAFALP